MAGGGAGWVVHVLEPLLYGFLYGLQTSKKNKKKYAENDGSSGWQSGLACLFEGTVLFDILFT